MRISSMILVALFGVFIPDLGNAQTSYALDFDGNGDYAEIPDADDLSLSSFTLEFWVKPIGQYDRIA